MEIELVSLNSNRLEPQTLTYAKLFQAVKSGLDISLSTRTYYKTN